MKTRQPNIYIWGDTHFGHQNMIPYCGRPENFDEILIKNYNKMRIQYNDTIIWLGDVIMGQNSQERLPSIIATLPGKHILVRGNHDVEKKWGTDMNFLSAGFSFVCDYYIYDKLVFSHCPITPLPMQANNHWNKQVEVCIHAHFHNSTHSTQESTDKENRFYDRNYYLKNQHKYQLVQIEDELRPFSLDEVIEMWSQKGGEEK